MLSGIHPTVIIHEIVLTEDTWCQCFVHLSHLHVSLEHKNNQAPTHGQFFDANKWPCHSVYLTEITHFSKIVCSWSDSQPRLHLAVELSFCFQGLGVDFFYCNLLTSWSTKVTVQSVRYCKVCLNCIVVSFEKKFFSKFLSSNFYWYAVVDRLYPYRSSALVKWWPKNLKNSPCWPKDFLQSIVRADDVC